MDFEVDHFIALVKERPILWDRTEPEYKNKFIKTDAWKSVCRCLFPNYDELDNSTKTQLGSELIKKWRGYKDNFYKYEKKIKEIAECGSSARIKQYHLYNQLLFLHKSDNETEITPAPQPLTTGIGYKPSIVCAVPHGSVSVSSDPISSVMFEDEDHDSGSTSEHQGSSKSNMPHYQSSSRKRKLDEFEDCLLKVLKEPESRHMSFFKGILPSVEKLNDDQTLIFQSRVLQILTDLQQPQWQQFAIVKTESE